MRRFTNKDFDYKAPTLYKLSQYENIEEKHNIKSFNDLDDRLKALEVIKREPLMICTEYYKCIVELKLTYQEFLKYFPNEKERAIKTQEEYDLLREVLLCED